MPGVLRLEARDYEGPARWRWVLTGASGAFVAGHEVRLEETSWQYEAFIDLQHYVSWHAAPDRYAEDVARIVAEVGQWIGSEVLGPVADALAKTARKTPVAVRVVVPEGAEALLFRPLELALARGRPLAAQDVTLVMQTAGDDSAGDAVPVGDRLRILGLFSLPEGGQPLNLRRERHAIVQLINRIAARGKAAEARVLQYGVTRERLREVLEEAEGWDVIHISGHGTPGELLLETTAGTLDKVTAAELADMLEPAREHVKLVTVAACWSAAMTAAQQRRLLGLPILKNHSPERTGGGSSSPGNFATELTERLGCAVLAMRYPVADDFAIELSQKLYDRLAAKGQPLARAVGMTVRELTAGNRFPALSAAAPALFGGCAAGLTLAAPRRAGPPSYGTGKLKMAGFPPQPERFVGRTGVMARASAALADESGVPGVLLHGMPGGGKTACALELAYTHEHAFDRLVWYTAPDEGMEISGALTDFALVLERYLEDFQMAHLVSDVGKLAGFLPRLTELMERSRLLVVIDNTESLLTKTGLWRDDRWGLVTGALTAHRGLGQVIMTSRRVPAETSGLRVEAVDALSADEALLLAREIPRLRDLVNGDLPGIDRDTARKLALGVLNVAQGHPKLLELAGGQAAHPERLADLVAAGDRAWQDQGGLPDGFFTTGQTRADPSGYLQVLAAWTLAITDTLSSGERALFWFLCCLEERDRQRSVLDTAWAGLWQLLARDSPPPGLVKGLGALLRQGLIGFRTEAASCHEWYAVHPGVAAAGRAQAGRSFQDAVDMVAGNCFIATVLHTSGLVRDSSVNTVLLVDAGMAAVPYLIRRGEWEMAAVLLSDVFNLDPSRENVAEALPAVQRIIDHDPRQAQTLAGIMRVVDPTEAETLMRGSLEAAVARGDYRTALATAERLADLCRDGGRLDAALDLIDRAIGYARDAGLGPIDQLRVKADRLQLLNLTGQAGRVLSEVQLLLNHTNAPHAVSGQYDDDVTWVVHEMLLSTGAEAARRVAEWDEALKLNAANVASMRKRRAPASEIAKCMFNDYGPLLVRDGAEPALSRLQQCLHIFRDANDVRGLGLAFSGIAQVEDARGNTDAAIRMERDALRYSYLSGQILSIAISYNNLGSYLRHNSEEPAAAFACHIIAALIFALAQAGDHDTIWYAASDLRELGADAEPSAGLSNLCRRIGDIPGTDPAGLIARLSSDPETAERTLQDIIAQARDLAETLPDDAAPK